MVRTGRMLVVAAALAAVRRAGPERQASQAASVDSAASLVRGDPASLTSGDTAAASRRDTTRALPPVGLAVPDSGRAWCATFEYAMLAHGSLAAGEHVTLVFPEPGVDSASYDARVRRERSAPCSTSFGAFGLGDSSRAYELEAVGSEPPAPYGGLTSALVVASDARWTRAADGTERADLDGDGLPEEARACLVDEGRYYTIRSASAPGAKPRWTAYFDLGALVDPTCAPGDSASP